MKKKTIYVVESNDNGVTVAFDNRAAALEEIIKAYCEYIPQMKDYTNNDNEVYSVNDQIKNDLESLIKYNWIEDFAYIHEIPYEEANHE